MTMTAWVTTAHTVRLHHPGAAPGIWITWHEGERSDKAPGDHVALSQADLPKDWGVDDTNTLVEHQIRGELDRLGYVQTGSWAWSPEHRCWTCQVVPAAVASR